MGESRAQAVSRFISFKRSLHARGQFRELEKVIDEYFHDHHAERVPLDEHDTVSTFGTRSSRRPRKASRAAKVTTEEQQVDETNGGQKENLDPETPSTKVRSLVIISTSIIY